jgi:SAM-dependent methyltransferase
MLRLAHKHQGQVAQRIGWNNVTFLRARIQDLRTDIEALEKRIADRPLKTFEHYQTFEELRQEAAASSPLIADESIDIVLSNCVLNLVRPEDRAQLFAEMYRVLRRGGRVAVADIVADEEVPEHLRRDPELWSGCVSGAFQEREFLRAFEMAGFYGICIDKRDERPWQTVEGIEFRSVTVTAYKGKEGPCLERKQAVIYKGPWSEVRDDDGHVLERGVPTAVCDKTFRIYTSEPYRDDIAAVPPRLEVPLEEARPFDCSRERARAPGETKGAEYRVTTEAAGICCPEESCC